MTVPFLFVGAGLFGIVVGLIVGTILIKFIVEPLLNFLDL